MGSGEKARLKKAIALENKAKANPELAAEKFVSAGCARVWRHGVFRAPSSPRHAHQRPPTRRLRTASHAGRRRTMRAAPAAKVCSGALLRASTTFEQRAVCF